MRRVVLTLSLVLAGIGPATAGRLPNDPPLVLDIHEGSFRLCMGWKTPTLITEAGTLKPLLWPKARGRDEQTAIPVQHSWYPPANWKELDFDDTYWPRTRGPVLIPQS